MKVVLFIVLWGLNGAPIISTVPFDDLQACERARVELGHGHGLTAAVENDLRPETQGIGPYLPPAGYQPPRMPRSGVWCFRTDG